MGVPVGIDVGGTFTDAALLDGDRIVVAKRQGLPPSAPR
ncbi:MAG: hydantoinase/oxoprolinase N-terminal domain-containing protein [Gaiellales bacterium]